LNTFSHPDKTSANARLSSYTSINGDVLDIASTDINAPGWYSVIVILINANLLYWATTKALRHKGSQRINLVFLSVIVTLWCNHAPRMKQIANKRDKTKIIVLPELIAHHIQYDLLQDYLRCITL